MAEWVMLIMFLVLGFGTYEFNRRVYESQTLLVWGMTGLILSLGLMIYIFSKVQHASQPWADRYQIEEDAVRRGSPDPAE